MLIIIFSLVSSSSFATSNTILPKLRANQSGLSMDNESKLSPNEAIFPSPIPNTSIQRLSNSDRYKRPQSIGFVLVADLDKKSRIENEGKLQFVSYLQHAAIKITFDKATAADELKKSSKDLYQVTWGENYRFSTSMNEAGRGCELSELTWFNGKLLTFDDRTGIIFQVKGFDGRKNIQIIPQKIVTERDGDSAKGQKHEWATVKDGELYMGSIGKEFIDQQGRITGDGFLWVAVLDRFGTIRHEDWTGKYGLIRRTLGCESPGYVVHEAIEWSQIHRKWFILPRRISKEPYNEETDETKGSNKMLIVSEDFSEIKVIEVGEITPTHGFASFKFLPRTQDSIIIALKSEEIEKQNSQNSFILIFDISGNVLLPEIVAPGKHKYEGVAFTYDWSMNGGAS